MARTRALLLLACCIAVLSAANGLQYNPCDPVTPVARGDPFVIGIALIPGMNLTALAELAANYGGLCNSTFQELLVNDYNAKLAIYNARVDRLQVLRMPYPDIIFNMVNASQPTMILVAFRANVTSPAVFIVSGDTGQTGGAGFVVAVSLLVRLDLGVLQYLQWYDNTCGECGGATSQLCIRSIRPGINACATPLDACSCTLSNGTQLANCSYDQARFDVCSTAINVAWMGTDVNSAVMRTGPQVQRLNAYSITALFNTARDKFSNVKNYLYTSVTQSWNYVSSDAQQQYVDFEGGLSQYDKRSPPLPPRPPPPAPPPAPPAPSPPLAPSPPPSPPPATPPPAPTAAEASPPPPEGEASPPPPPDAPAQSEEVAAEGRRLAAEASSLLDSTADEGAVGGGSGSEQPNERQPL